MNSDGEDLFPVDEESQAQTTAWAISAFKDAQANRQELEERWLRYYKMYRSYGGKRKKNDWRSRVWLPVSFYIIETILPRLMAQLPKFRVEPVGPEDREGAEQMEALLDYCSDQSDLYLELVKAFKSALIYGTGILKTMYDEKFVVNIFREPVLEPVMEEVEIGDVDIDGNPLTQSVQVGSRVVGMRTVRQPVITYAGPVAEAVDVFDFFVSPEATCMEDASYVIHRVYRTRAHIEKMARQGHYRLPEDLDWELLLNAEDYPASMRLSEVDLGSGSQPQTTKGTKLIEVRELWTDDVVLTMLGDRVLVRAERNPFAHGEKPFVRVVDHLVPHEFWGVGELEPMEGIQDTMNALWNSRIDNVKLVLNRMFAVSMEYIQDPADLRVRPGGVIRLREGIPIDQAFKPIDLGEVTSSSYTEAAEMERMSEKVSGVSAYQMGTDSPALNRTATGVALISEQGNTRFAHKVRISELTGLRRLAKHFGSILQQYMPEGMVVRLQGPGGQWMFQTIDQQSIVGAFDYNIEAESASQTESIRREQTLSLFQMLIGLPQVNPFRLIQDVLQTFGRKDIQSYLLQPPGMMDPAMMQDPMMQQQMMQEQQMMMQGGMGAPTEQSAGPQGGGGGQPAPPQ